MSTPDDESAEAIRDTLPMGEEVPRSQLLETVVDADWKKATTVRAENAPNEAYWCDVDGARLHFERKGRLWHSSLVPEDDQKIRKSEPTEDLGRAARDLERLLQSWRDQRSY